MAMATAPTGGSTLDSAGVPSMLGDFFSGIPTSPVHLQSPDITSVTGTLTTPIVTYTPGAAAAPVLMTTKTGDVFLPDGTDTHITLNSFHLASIAQSQFAPTNSTDANGPTNLGGFFPSTLNPASKTSPPLPFVPNLGKYSPQATIGTVLNVIIPTTNPADLTALQDTITHVNGVIPRTAANLQTFPTAGESGYVSFPQPPGSSTAFVFAVPAPTVADPNAVQLEAALPGNFTHVFEVNLPFAATAGAIKIGDNDSPLPRDRIIFDYSFFDNTTLAPGGINVNRFTAGFEKTLFSDKFSIEFRLPFATTFDSNITIDGSGEYGPPGNTALTNQHAIELGNAFFLTKALLWKADTTAVSTGLGVGLPTASDINVTRSDGENLYRIVNGSPHLMPYVGGVWTPSERWFIQSMAQLDFDLTGNRVVINEDPNKQASADGVFVDAGKLKFPIFAFVDLSLGYWFWHLPPGSDRFITGLAGMFELHYNQTLGDFDSVSAPMINSVGQQQEYWNPNTQSLQPLALQVGGSGSFSSLDLTAGFNIEIRDDAYLSLGVCVPTFGGTGHEFDYEVRANFSYYFGRSTKQYRVGVGSAPSTL
jgi:hypothetical protein